MWRWHPPSSSLQRPIDLHINKKDVTKKETNKDPSIPNSLSERTTPSYRTLLRCYWENLRDTEKMVSHVQYSKLLTLWHVVVRQRTSGVVSPVKDFNKTVPRSCVILYQACMKVRKKVITKKGGILYFNYRRSEWSLLSKLVNE